MKTVAGEGEKKSEIFGGPAEVGPAEGCLAQSLGCRIWVYGQFVGAKTEIEQKQNGE